MSPRAARSTRVGVSLALLIAVAFWLDIAEVLDRLGQLRPAWVVAAIGVSVGQVVLSAWRWRYTAGRLGQQIPLGRAVGEYYRATLLNQLLPGGVVGDVSRAWRYAGPGGGGGRAVSAVVLDRLSGQAVMTGVAILSGVSLLWGEAIGTPGGGQGGGPVGGAAVGSGDGWGGAGWVVAGAGVLLLAFAGPFLIRKIVRFPPLARVADDARTALLGSALPVQLTTSLAVVASYLAVFLMAARAVGVDTPLAILLPLVAPVLVTMLLPVTVAGWGLREGAAAALWHAVGLTAADGVAVSVAYGLLVLVSSIPGLLFLGFSPPGPQATKPDTLDPGQSRRLRASRRGRTLQRRRSPEVEIEEEVVAETEVTDRRP